MVISIFSFCSPVRVISESSQITDGNTHSMLHHCTQLQHHSLAHVTTPRVSNPWTASLYYMGRSHICRLCIYYKNFTIIQAVRYTTYCYFSCVARKPAHNNGCGLLSYKGWRHMHYILKLLQFQHKTEVSLFTYRKQKYVFTIHSYIHSPQGQCYIMCIIQGVTGGTDQTSGGCSYVKLYRKNPKHLCPKFNGLGDNGN